MGEIVVFDNVDEENVLFRHNNREAEWNPDSTKGLTFTNRHLHPGETIHFVLTGTGIVNFGMLYRDPNTITSLKDSKKNEIKFLFDTFLNAEEEYTVIVEMERGLVRHKVTWFHAGYHHPVNVCFTKYVWLAVNLFFGNVKISIGKEFGTPIAFSSVIGSNVTFIDSEKDTAHLTIATPPFTSYLTHTLRSDQILNLKIKSSWMKSIVSLHPSELIISYLVPQIHDEQSDILGHRNQVKGSADLTVCQIFSGRVVNASIKIEVQDKNFILFVNMNKKIYFKEIQANHMNGRIQFAFQGFRVKLEILEPFIQIDSSAEHAQSCARSAVLPTANTGDSLVSSTDSSGYIRTQFIQSNKTHDRAVAVPSADLAPDIGARDHARDNLDSDYEPIDFNQIRLDLDDINASLDSTGYIRLDSCKSTGEEMDESMKIYEKIWPSLQREIKLSQNNMLRDSTESD